MMDVVQNTFDWSRDEIGARLTSLHNLVKSLDKVDITDAAKGAGKTYVNNMVEGICSKNTVNTITEAGSNFQTALVGYTEAAKEFCMTCLNDLTASTFDIPAKIDQIKTMKMEDFVSPKTVQSLRGLTDFSAACEALKQQVACLLEPVAKAVATVNQKPIESTPSI